VAIEERILVGLQLKTDLFEAVFEPTAPEPAQEAGEEAEENLDVSDEDLLADMTHESDSNGQEAPPAGGAAVVGAASTPADAVGLLASQSPERVEAILNSGMAFIGGLLEMATGSKLGEGKPTVQIDRQTGELTLKMKLPGF